MGYDTQANDWKVAGVENIGIGAEVYAGTWWFVFSSEQANLKEPFVFCGGGLGVGLKYKGGTIAGAGTVSPAQFSDIPATNSSAFSFNELHNAMGRITSASVSFMIGYGITYITAFTSKKALFSSVELDGWITGVSATMNSCAGVWRALRYDDKRAEIEVRSRTGTAR